jgi:hypothetical protein
MHARRRRENDQKSDKRAAWPLGQCRRSRPDFVATIEPNLPRCLGAATPVAQTEFYPAVLARPCS